MWSWPNGVWREAWLAAEGGEGARAFVGTSLEFYGRFGVGRGRFFCGFYKGDRRWADL